MFQSRDFCLQVVDHDLVLAINLSLVVLLANCDVPVELLDHILSLPEELF
jgi:hypothetical protein